MSDPDKVLMQIIDTMLPILTGAMRSTVTGLLDEAYAQGVADERARVVADLRRKANIISALSKAFAVSTARALRDRADHYERGGHESESVTTAAVKSDDRCPFPGCNGVKDHVECPTCGQEHCDRCFS